MLFPTISAQKPNSHGKRGLFQHKNHRSALCQSQFPVNHPSLRWGAGKTTDFFGSLQIPVNLEGGTLQGAAPRKKWRLDELKSRGKNLFWGSMEPHPDRIHLNYCGILTFSKETEGAPIPQREFGRFCDVPGILGCFSLRCPREAAQDLCPSSSLQQNCSDQDFPSIHAASLAWISQDSHLSLCFVSQGFLLPLS